MTKIKSLKWLLLLSLIFTLPVIAQTSKQQLFEQFFLAFNAPDHNSLRHYIDNHFSPTLKNRFDGKGAERYFKYLGSLKHFHHQFEQLDSQGSSIFNVKVKSHNTQHHYQISIGFSQSTPYQVESWRISDAPAPDLNNPPLTQTQALNQLDQYIKRLAKKQVFSGSVLIAKGDKVLYQSAQGLAHRGFNISNNINTKFNLGSMNKMFTAVAILQLVEQQKLKLDDKLTDFIDPKHLPQGEVDQITIAQLLTHTSGLGNYFGSQFSQSSKRLYRNIRDFLPLIKDTPLRFNPGSRYAYSSSGMLLLGLVIEKASGKNYFDYISQHIYQIAGMKDSGSYDVDIPTPNLATGYHFNANLNSWQDNSFYHVAKGGPAGGGYASAPDLHKFALALQQNRLLSRHYTEQATSAKPGLNSPGFGYGFAVGQDYSGKIFGHDGGYIGISSMLTIQQESGMIIVILSNRSHGADPIATKIEQLFRQ